jgi:hypothetical protein
MNTSSQTGSGASSSLHLPARRLSLSTMYAWGRIMETYLLRHPRHQVRVLYRHQVVQDLKQLVLHSPNLDPGAFEVRVQTPDGDSAEVPRLLALMHEAAEPHQEHFLTDDRPERWFSGAAAGGRSG